MALLFTSSAGMPCIGLLLGAPREASSVAARLTTWQQRSYSPSAHTLLLAGEDEEVERARLVTADRRGPLGAVALGLSISLDELAIGFSAGLLGLPTVPLIAAIAIQTFVVTQVGIRIGSQARRALARTPSASPVSP